MASELTQTQTTVLNLIRDRVRRRQWRSETEREVSNFARSCGYDRKHTQVWLDEVKRQYDAAGAGWNGRFQS